MILHVLVIAVIMRNIVIIVLNERRYKCCAVCRRYWNVILAYTTVNRETVCNLKSSVFIHNVVCSKISRECIYIRAGIICFEKHGNIMSERITFEFTYNSEYSGILRTTSCYYRICCEYISGLKCCVIPRRRIVCNITILIHIIINGCSYLNPYTKIIRIFIGVREPINICILCYRTSRYTAYWWSVLDYHINSIIDVLKSLNYTIEFGAYFK